MPRRKRSSREPQLKSCRSGRWTIATWVPASRVPSPSSCNRRTFPPCEAKSTVTRTGWTMSGDGPTLNDGPGHNHGHGHAHSHPLTAGQQAHSHEKGRSAKRKQPTVGDHLESWTEGAGHLLDLPVVPSAVDVFDTTLRDGSQQEGLSLTVDDKLRVAEQLDHLGVTFIEGGWPGANPKDEEFFARAPAELHLATAPLVACGPTRRAGVRPEDDEVLRHLVKANTEAVC